MNKVVSFDLFADFGFFKKPFSNEKLDLYLTFNMMHKPALLGILGAILGLKGYKENGVLPEYYKQLSSLKIGIEPIEFSKWSLSSHHEKGIFPKTTLKYNNAVGYANSQGGILNINEQILISPAYRCYVMLDESIDKELQTKLENYLRNGYAEYIPYFGKNEFSCWWEKDSFREYSTIENKTNEPFNISSIFYLSGITLKESESDLFDFFNTTNPFAFFERLPIGFIEIEKNRFQYEIEKFVYSNFQIKANTQINDLYVIQSNNEAKYVQLF